MWIAARFAPPRILVLSASAGVGHLRAAEAIELALRQTHPEAHVVNVDVLQYTNAAFRHFFAQTYFDVIKHAPHFVGFMYDRLDKPGWPPMERLRTKFQRVQFGKFTDLLLSQPWDLAINTHFLPAEFISSLRLEGRLKLPQVMVTTDFYIHCMWVKQPVERYYMASRESAINLSNVVPLSEMEVTGIPIHPAFGEAMDPTGCRRKHGISVDRNVVLQLAGGFGVGPIEQIHRRLLECQTPLHVVVATGRNARVRTRLEAIPLPSHHRRTVLGFTSDMPELMTAADVVVSKPGGLTTSEAMATGTPMVVVDPIPGQESRNSDYLLENGAAIKANTLQSLPHKLDVILSDGARLKQMQANARRIGHPRAAFDVVERAMKLISTVKA
ncbi:MGDG synthase family glycosyltransferase [Humisphaera borealis]|uniref:Glycosyltransferase n=1 Tax=Humisphaera borealis TaxID=2807512 RepID=A0A7M2WZ93_9BACT|nr:glycosyltransferase [Humisphaera borealis]QOV90828.1 glycosyltransferase [Humisphaera borealis]